MTSKSPEGPVRDFAFFSDTLWSLLRISVDCFPGVISTSFMMQSFFSDICSFLVMDFKTWFQSKIGSALFLGAI